MTILTLLFIALFAYAVIAPWTYKPGRCSGYTDADEAIHYRADGEWVSVNHPHMMADAHRMYPKAWIYCGNKLEKPLEEE